ncbi:helix-turn-helix domain-containing protein [Streptomyces sp. NBC_00237]|uniref:helix-turn-helix domain-containing protein n=1 Tax=Streptomyces sp. NBC_00237 TaxID=2975687 RepID=UPI002254F875|nr:helix-turn-helix transcriptional regulator [Streptomyces sp. NBC_00237]MCX5204978.1 helix-turn-helix domain-containing protein [Streptomyces sp. NBC_00237]
MPNQEQEATPEIPSQEDGTAHLFRALGKQIKTLREHRGMKQTELALAVNFGPDLISAVERGTRTPQPSLLEAADPVLGAHGTLIAAIPDVEEALTRSRTRHPHWYRDYAGLEKQALEIHHYGNQVVHGLLQTEAYARAIFTWWRPLLSEETVEKRVADRLSRQVVLEKWPPSQFGFIFEEVVLRRPIGGRAVHHEQLRRLLEAGNQRNITIQVIETECGEHPNSGGAFNLLTAKNEQRVAYTEVQGHPRLITDPREVREMQDRYGIMQTLALRPDASRALIERILGDR